MTSIGQMSPQSVPARPLKMVTLGDSVAAGMQDYTVTDAFQKQSFSAHLAEMGGSKFRAPKAKSQESSIFRRGRFSVSGALKKLGLNAALSALPRAFMALGFTPPKFFLKTLSRAGDLSLEQSPETLTNFGIPGFEARHIRDVTSESDFAAAIQRGEESIDSLPIMLPAVRGTLDQASGHETSGSQLDKVIASQPDLVTITAPANDFLAAMGGVLNDTECTPMEDRRWTLTSGQRSKGIISGIDSTYRGENGIITQLLDKTDAHVMLFNMGLLPSAPLYLELGKPVGELPYRLTLPGGEDISRELESFVLPKGIKGSDDSAFAEGSRVSVDKLVRAITTAYVRSGFDTKRMWEALRQKESLFNEDEVADAQEIETILKRVESYNLMAEELAQNPRVHLVDMHQFDLDLNEGKALIGQGEPIRVGRSWAGVKDDNGHRGIYSDDGLHPDALGHAMVANLVLKTAKENLSDNPRFDKFTQADFIDEKALYQERSR